MYNTHDDDYGYIGALASHVWNVNLLNIIMILYIQRRIDGQQTVWERKWIICEHTHVIFFIHSRR